MKILQVGMPNGVGGIESFLINFQRSLDCKEIEMDYLCIYSNQGELFYKEELLKRGAKIINVPSYQKNFIKSYAAIKELLKKEKYDVVHYNMNSACFLIPLVAAKKAGVKVIVAHAHNASSDKGFLKKIIHNINKHFIPYFSNLFFSCSEKAGRWFFSDKIRNSYQYHLIPNSIDGEKYAFDESIRNEIRTEFNINDKFVIGHIGRFCRQKNHTFLLEVFEAILKKESCAILFLIGEGDLKEEIEKKIIQHDIDDKVIVLSRRNDIHRILQAFDCFLLPSLYEGLPVVGIEAQAAGLPCYFSDTITKETDITKNCKFMHLNNPMDWADTILKDRNIFVRRNMKRSIFESGFDTKNLAFKIINYYKNVYKED